MKLSKHFEVQELVNPDIISRLGEERAANCISVSLIQQLERLRVRFGVIIVNNYNTGGSYKNSGLRKASFYTKFGVIRESYSTHQYGTTADLKFVSTDPVTVYNYILQHRDEFPFIIRMENANITKTWLHIECGKKTTNPIQVFNP